jgi:hypothetical protein
MNLDPAVPCEKSFANVDPTQMKYMVAHGSYGLPGIVSWDGMLLGIDKDGSLQGWVDRLIAFGRAIPDGLRKDLERASLRINNSKILAIDVLDKAGAIRVLVLRKSDNTWHRLPKLTEMYAFLRGFDHFITVTESSVKNAQHPESAGRASWRKKDTRRGPSIAEAFDENEETFPGRLHLYDVNTGQVYTITTNQGDSEVVLVEDGTVYYRVSDRLYSAPITKTGIGVSKLLATDESIRDAHWAFIKH